jgi:hypothetical protein
MFMKKSVVFGLFLAPLLVFFSCENISRNKSYAAVPLANIKKGKALAQKFCASCHLLPDPSLAAAQTWEEGILPNMGPRLGIFEHNFNQYPSAIHDKNVGRSFYPSRPLLSGQEWQYILDYYTATAPDSLPYQEREQKISMGLSQFDVQTPALSGRTPAVSFIRKDSLGAENGLLLYDLVTQTLYRYNSSLKPTDSVAIGGCVVDAVVQNGRMLTCNMGNINPMNAKLGTAQYLNVGANGKLQQDTASLIRNLARPVEITPADLNEDGRTDYLVAEFGFTTGSLSWFEQTPSRAFTRHELRSLPGAIKTYVQDYNRDGLPDLWVLFAQGDESIVLFTNRGDGRFDQEQVLRFPPSFGSTFFELVDMNGDGFQDIVYTCGDNADYSIQLKPYHGVYLYYNDGKNHFSKKYFFPINGCYKALARDFDGDGDLDVATISFFADYARQPEEGFVYLENRGGLAFRPLTFPESRTGRWLTLEACDLDGDKKTDLLLGNFAAGPSFLRSSFDWTKGPAFIFLRNKAEN